MTTTRIEISYKTIVFAFAVAIALWLIIQVLQILVLLFVALILVSTFHSPVDTLSKYHIPRAFSILIIYLLFLTVVGIFIGIIIPPLVDQIGNFGTRIPEVSRNLDVFLSSYKIPTANVTDTFTKEFSGIGSNALRFTFGLFGSLLSIITLLVLTFYMLLEWQKVVKLVSSVFSGRSEQRAIKIINDIQKGLGAWVRGELTLVLVVGLLSFVGLTILGIPYALPLAVIAGILEIVPVVGPIIASVPAIAAALLISPVFALATTALYFVIQQLENHLIVPTVMNRAVGLNPLATIIALMVGGRLLGIGGAILAVPIVVVLKIVVSDILENRPVKESQQEG